MAILLSLMAKLQKMSALHNKIEYSLQTLEHGQESPNLLRMTDLSTTPVLQFKLSISRLPITAFPLYCFLKLSFMTEGSATCIMRATFNNVRM